MSASNAGGGKAAPGIDANRSGVFRAPASLNSVRELAKKAVLAWLELSLDAVSNKLQFLDACARQLKLPVHFGGNWDALADCLEVAVDVQRWQNGSRHLPIESPSGLAALVLGVVEEVA